MNNFNEFFKNAPVIKIECDEVICDYCGDDYTHSEDTGGFLFGSYAVCPKCAETALPRIKKYGEEKYIQHFCPKNLSFAEYVSYLCR